MVGVACSFLPSNVVSLVVDLGGGVCLGFREIFDVVFPSLSWSSFFFFVPVMMESNLGSLHLLFFVHLFLLRGMLSLWLVATSFSLRLNPITCSERLHPCVCLFGTSSDVVDPIFFFLGGGGGHAESKKSMQLKSRS